MRLYTKKEEPITRIIIVIIAKDLLFASRSIVLSIMSKKFTVNF